MVPGMPELRKIILDPTLNMSGAAMEFVFAAMRLETHRYYESVADQYDIIVSDRGWWSHIAYTTHNVSAEFVDRFYNDLVGTMTQKEDLIVYMSISQETARQRRVKRGLAVDAIEAKGEGYLNKVIDTFNDLVANDPIRHEVVDANGSLDQVKGSLDNLVPLITDMVMSKGDRT
jgi:thymidylate kinase